MSDRKPGHGTLIAFVLIGSLLTSAAVGFVGWMLHNDLVTLAAAIARAGQARGNAPAREAEEAAPANVDNWQALVRSHNGTIGAADAPVTIIEFSDFECPFCRRYYENTHAQLLKAYEGRIRFVYKQLPLVRIHSNAMAAAVATQCAGREGKFWAMHDAIFENTDMLKDGQLVALGEQIGLGASFRSCVTNEETRAEVEADMKDATTAGVRGTPGFLINGKVVSGALPFEAFKAEIDALL